MNINFTLILTYMFEIIVDLCLMRSLVGIKWHEILSKKLLLVPFCAILNLYMELLFPTLFGWLLILLSCLLTCKKILNINFSNVIFSFLISYILYSLLEALAILAVPKKMLMEGNSKGQLLGTFIVLILSIGISFLPLNRFYKRVNQGNLIIKLIVSYISLLLLVTIALSKVNSIDAIAILPLTVTFMIILLLADIMVLKQQRTITIQQQDIKDYQTYEPMAHNLISDILGKQHDFNNQMNAIRMLPYTYKDYDSLSEAIVNYSAFLEEEFNESELLKVNLPVVAGFVFSKIKEAEQKGRLMSVTIKNQSLITSVPEYDLIRILGILIDNAIEATAPGHTFTLTLDSRDEHIHIQTKNEGSEISSEMRKKMFVRGYSTKTSAETRSSRGQGLPNLKELVDQYNGKIYLDNETFQDHVWICFSVEL